MPSSLMTAGGGLSKSKLRLADAEEGNVLINKTFYGGEDKLIRTGTMPDNGAVDYTVAPGESVTIPAGYHNGSGVVRGTKTPFEMNSAAYELHMNNTSREASTTLSVDYSSKGLTKIPTVFMCPYTTWIYAQDNNTVNVKSYELTAVTATTATGTVTYRYNGPSIGTADGALRFIIIPND